MSSQLLRNETRASCAIIALECKEPERVARMIASQEYMEKYNAWLWRISAGLAALKENFKLADRGLGNKAPKQETKKGSKKKAKAKSAGQAPKEAKPITPEAGSFSESPEPLLNWFVSTEERSVLFIPEYKALADDPSFWSTVASLFGSYGPAKARGLSLVFIGPDAWEAIPPQLETEAVYLETGLPDAEELAKVVPSVAKSAKLGKIDDAQIQRLAEEAVGLTSYEFETTLARCVIENKELTVNFVQQETERRIKKMSGLKVVAPQYSFDDVGGFEAAKEYMSILTVDMPPELAAKMIVFLGPPGTGKSMVAYALAKKLGWKAYELNIGSLLTKYVGESERKIREVLSFLESTGSAVVVLDEIEKAFAGSGSDSSGVTTRLMGEFLTWNQNRKNKTLIVATANDIQGLPEELFRAGRVDKLYWVDVPSAEQRATIQELKADQFKLTPEERDWPNMVNWTGAEIEQLCKEFARYKVAGSLKPLKALAAGIRPVANRISDKLTRVRQFAMESCVDASTGFPVGSPPPPPPLNEQSPLPPPPGFFPSPPPPPPGARNIDRS